MALRDLLVHVDQAERAPERLRLAADLAHRNGSRLTAIYVKELTAAQIHEQSVAELGLAPSAAVVDMYQRIRDCANEAAERLRKSLEELSRSHGLEVEWRCLDGIGSTLVPQHARFFDLCILSQDAHLASSAVGYTFAEELLFVTGRPVLFIPAAGSFATLGRHILVAWNSSRAAARAVNDSLPLIERAERVTLLAVNPAEFAARYGALPPEQMVAHLKRHGAAVDEHRIDDVPVPQIADALQIEAHRLGADVIVAGAFGHPKLWEKLIGGVTRDLLAHMSLPVFMSY